MVLASNKTLSGYALSRFKEYISVSVSTLSVWIDKTARADAGGGGAEEKTKKWLSWADFTSSRHVVSWRTGSSRLQSRTRATSRKMEKKGRGGAEQREEQSKRRPQGSSRRDGAAREGGATGSAKGWRAQTARMELPFVGITEKGRKEGRKAGLLPPRPPLRQFWTLRFEAAWHYTSTHDALLLTWVSKTCSTSVTGEGQEGPPLGWLAHSKTFAKGQGRAGHHFAFGPCIRNVKRFPVLLKITLNKENQIWMANTEVYSRVENRSYC